MCAAAGTGKPDAPVGTVYVDDDGVEYELVGYESNGAHTYYGLLEPTTPQPGHPAQVRVRLGTESAFKMRSIQ